MVNNLNYLDLKFPISIKRYRLIEQKNNTCINLFCYENDLIYSVHVPDKTFEDCMNLFLITDENKSHYVYVKEFMRPFCNKTKIKNKKHFWRYCL